MKDSLVKVVKEFLMDYWEPGDPLLIGLSGGEDSSALLSLLIECRSFFSLDLHIAHFDHGWREESREEALALQTFVESFGVPFHVERSMASLEESSNLEEKARIERFLFFQRVYKKIGAQALILAHQREDQAETILKRIFEGAGVLSLGGMQKSSFYETMIVWRPLLGVSREEIQKWNKKKSWIPFQDRTNKDLKFLRPRMREELFPQLEKCFGKKVKHSLFRIGEEISLLKGSFEKKLQLYLDQSLEGCLGSFLPFMSFGVVDPFEKQELIRLFLRKHQVSISRDVLKKTVSLLEANLLNKQVDVSKGELLVDRGSLIWLNSFPESFLGQVVLKDSFLRVQQGAWLWEVEKGARSLKDKERSWLACFLQGRISYPIKEGEDLFLSSYDSLEEKDQKKISSCLAKNKVPAKMKKIFPFIINRGRLFGFDFCFDLDLNNEKQTVFANIILKK